MAGLWRKKVVSEQPHAAALARTLSWPHLVALGVGAIVGTGILTLIGVGAGLAGPAVILSFVIAGAICACAALAYAEMATMIPASGSAYTYSYVVIGELVAWIIGWSLILEYSLVVSTVAVGWSGYAAPLLQSAFGFPDALMKSPELGGVVNLPAIFIIAVVAAVLCAGTKESATLNAVLVVVKIVALAVFVAVALPEFDGANLQPLHALWLSQGARPRWGGARGDGGGGDHLLRLLRLRRDLDRGGGNEESRPRPRDRHRRIDGRVRRDLHPRRGHRGRCAALHPLCRLAPSRWR